MSTEPVLGAAERLLARALAGESDALAAAAELPEAEVARHAVASALARLAGAAGIEPPESWRRQRIAAAARWLLLAETRESAARALSPARVPWLVIKGCDLADRVYDAPEDRPSSDLDLLVRAEDFDAARGALEEAGWASLTPGPLAERYLVEEGYAWQARRDGLALVEVHFRLWGLVPDGLAETLVEGAVDAAPGGGRRPNLAGAYLLAAVHLGLDPPPRALRVFWDLERIAARAGEDGVDLGREVVDLATRFDLQLPVALAAARAAALWPRPASRRIAAGLGAALRPPERWLAARAARGGLDAPRLGSLSLARLLSGRRSRGGWRVVPRQLWAHPGVVVQETPERWSGPRRRLAHLGYRLGLGRRR